MDHCPSAHTLITAPSDNTLYLQIELMWDKCCKSFSYPNSKLQAEIAMVTRCTRKKENDIPDTNIRLSMGYVVSSSGPYPSWWICKNRVQIWWRWTVIILERKLISTIACITGEEWSETSTCIVSLQGTTEDWQEARWADNQFWFSSFFYFQKLCRAVSSYWFTSVLLLISICSLFFWYTPSYSIPRGWFLLIMILLFAKSHTMHNHYPPM